MEMTYCMLKYIFPSVLADSVVFYSESACSHSHCVKYGSLVSGPLRQSYKEHEKSKSGGCCTVHTLDFVVSFFKPKYVFS